MLGAGEETLEPETKPPRAAEPPPPRTTGPAQVRESALGAGKTCVASPESSLPFSGSLPPPAPPSATPAEAFLARRAPAAGPAEIFPEARPAAVHKEDSFLARGGLRRACGALRRPSVDLWRGHSGRCGRARMASEGRAMDCGAPALNCGAPAIECGATAFECGAGAFQCRAGAFECGGAAIDSRAAAIQCAAGAMECEVAAMDCGAAAVDSQARRTAAGAGPARFPRF